MLFNEHETFQYHCDINKYCISGIDYYDVHFYTVYLDAKNPNEKHTKLRMNLTQSEFSSFCKIFKNYQE
jgi:hypothetical protein